MPLRFVSRTILFPIITLAALVSQTFVLNLVAATPPRDLGLPSGTEVEVRLMDELTTENAEPGDTFTATLMRSVVVNGRRVVARDTTVQGRVVEAVSSGRLKRPASITLELTHAGAADAGDRTPHARRQVPQGTQRSPDWRRSRSRRNPGRSGRGQEGLDNRRSHRRGCRNRNRLHDGEKRAGPARRDGAYIRSRRSGHCGGSPARTRTLL